MGSKTLTQEDSEAVYHKKTTSLADSERIRWFWGSFVFKGISEIIHEKRVPWDMSRMWVGRIPHIWMSHMSQCEWLRSAKSHVTHANESCHTCKWVTRVNETCYTCHWVVSLMWKNRVTYANEVCHTCEWVISHTWMRHVTCEWVMRHYQSAGDSRTSAIRHMNP